MATHGDNNQLALSWHDMAWIPHLNPGNIMEYFAERSNIFYDRGCNNEMIRMQRLSPDQLQNMVGIEYQLIHVQEPILYVVRKQNRMSPTQVTPLADYYIVGGYVYQAPDLGSVLNSRLLNTMHYLNSAFTETQSYSHFHPSKGYYWDFRDAEQNDAMSGKDKKKKKEEPSSLFQRHRVDILLGELTKKFPPKAPGGPVVTAQGAPPGGPPAAPPNPAEKQEDVKDIKPEVKTEKLDDKAPLAQNNSKPPPEKKAKFIR